MYWDWDLGIFHPDCTYLTNSAAWAFTDGPYHQQVKPGTLVGAARREARDEAIAEVQELMRLPYPWIIENPIGAISTKICKPTQIIQPYEFGEDASKATCLWIKGVAPLKPTSRFNGRWVTHNGRQIERWSNQTDSGQNRLQPSSDRWKIRSETYRGIAEAMADQWSPRVYDQVLKFYMECCR